MSWVTIVTVALPNEAVCPKKCCAYVDFALTLPGLMCRRARISAVAIIFR